MPWCPKCKSEYREGITTCADCKVELVEDLQAVKEEEEAVVNPYEEYVTEVTPEDVVQARGTVKVYHDNKSKADDFKSSAYTLLIVGILGIVAIVLIELGVIPFRMVAPGKYITYGVMGALFLLFIVMGISSFGSAKKYANEAKKEDDLTSQIRSWVLENVTKEYIVQKSGVPAGMPEEMKYFRYFAILKSAIAEEFGVLDASYLESLSEELYAEIFEEA